MQIYKKSFFGLVATFTLISVAVPQSNNSTSKSQIKMPEMPTISNIPQMPSISAPAIGGKFYTPGSNDFYKGFTPSKPNSPQVENTNSSSNNTSSQSVQANKTQNSENAKVLSTLLGSTSSLLNSSSVTAMDISNMSNNNLVGSLYNLTGGINASGQDTQILLTEILHQLEEIKKQQDSANLSSNKAESSVNRSKILRFTINGNNILNTCRTVFFSQKENDGSFLLTADRKYDFNSQSRDETFYLLFKADGNCGYSAGYNVQPKVIQDSKNEDSPLFKLSQQKSLHADKTGNLVSLKVVSEKFNLDLLLDIGK